MLCRLRSWLSFWFAFIFSQLNQPWRFSFYIFSYSLASLTVQRSDDGLFFQSVVPVTAGFLFPPHRSGWHTCRKERKSLPKRCILDLNLAPPSRRFVSFTGIWFIGGGGREVPGKETTRHTWSFYLKTGLKTLGRSAEPWGRSHTCLTPWRRKTARRVCIRFIHTWREECCFFWRVSSANKSETSQV